MERRHDMGNCWLVWNERRLLLPTTTTVQRGCRLPVFGLIPRPPGCHHSRRRASTMSSCAAIRQNCKTSSPVQSRKVQQRSWTGLESLSSDFGRPWPTDLGPAQRDPDCQIQAPWPPPKMQDDPLLRTWELCRGQPGSIRARTARRGSTANQPVWPVWPTRQPDSQSDRLNLVLVSSRPSALPLCPLERPSDGQIPACLLWARVWGAQGASTRRHATCDMRQMQHLPFG